MWLNDIPISERSTIFARNVVHNRTADALHRNRCMLDIILQENNEVGW